MKKFFSEKKGFTLAEVLISLSIIGVIAALTVPSVVYTTERRSNSAALKKAFIKMNDLVDMAQGESRFQPLKCFYWSQNPYSSCNAVKVADINGNATWKCADGSEVPADYNGNFEQCGAFYKYIVDNLKISKVCDNNALANGCVPEYSSGMDIEAKKNRPKNEGESDEAYQKRIDFEVAGCGGWTHDALKSKSAIVTTDGMIFFPYDNNDAKIFAVDVNGKKAPNKFGHDVFFMQLVGTPGRLPAYEAGGCDIVEKGGLNTWDMLKYSK